MADVLRPQVTIACAAWAKLTVAGLVPFIRSVEEYSQADGAPCLRGIMDPAIVPALEADRRFAHGPFYKLHGDVGSDLIDFRSYSTELGGKGSLQLVLDKGTGAFYADVDRGNPYQDVVGATVHLFGEVLPDTIRGWFRRKKRHA